MQDALCYSTTKRAILAEKEASRTPIKIARFTRTADHTKLVVNDIAHVTAPNSLECPFQFCQNLDNQTTTTLEKLDEAPEDKLTIFCKVLKLSETKVVGRAKYNVANATIADNTGQIRRLICQSEQRRVNSSKIRSKTTHGTQIVFGRQSGSASLKDQSPLKFTAKRTRSWRILSIFFFCVSWKINQFQNRIFG